LICGITREVFWQYLGTWYY